MSAPTAIPFWGTETGGNVLTGLVPVSAVFHSQQIESSLVYGLIDYAFSGSPDFTGVLPGHKLNVSGFLLNANNGSGLDIVQVFQDTDTIRIRTTARTTNQLDETGVIGTGSVTTSGTLITPPPVQKQAQGAVPGEKPGAGVENWWRNLVGQWLEYFATTGALVINAEDLEEMAAFDTSGFAVGRVALVKYIGMYRWQSGSALTADGYTVVDSDVDGQWMLEFDSLSFQRVIDSVETWELPFDYHTPGMFKIHYDADITTGNVDIDVDDATEETLDDSSTKDWLLLPGSQLTIISRDIGALFELDYVESEGSGAFTANSPSGVSGNFDFNIAGDRVFVTGRDGSINEHLRQFGIGAAWDVTASPTHQANLNVNSVDSNKRGCRLSPDNQKIFYAGATNNRIYQFSMPTPGSLSGASYDSVFISTPTWSGAAVSTFCLSPDGSRLFLISSISPYSALNIYQYNLATPGRINSVTQPKTVDIGAVVPPASTSYSIDCTDGGSRVFVASRATRTIYQFTLGTPGEIDSFVYDGKSHTFDAGLSDITGIRVHPNGTHIYINNNGTIHQFLLAELFAGTVNITAEFIK